MTHEPLHPPATFQELPSSGLKSLPESGTPTRPTRLWRKASCCLLAGGGGRGEGPGWKQVLDFCFLCASSFEPAGDPGSPWEEGTGQVCSQGARGLASRDPVLLCLAQRPGGRQT